MIIKPFKLREEIKDAFSSVRSTFCEYVELLDDRYLVPPHDKALQLILQYWEPIKKTKWVQNIGDCDNRAIKLYSDVHWHRVKQMEDGEIQKEDRYQWSFGYASGKNPFGNVHTFNLLRSDEGLFVFDNKIKLGTNYEPLSVRF